MKKVNNISEHTTKILLSESSKVSRHLFENLNDAAFLADATTGIIIDANKQAEKLLGKDKKEIIGMHQKNIHPPEKSKEYINRFLKHVKYGHAVDYEGEVIKKDKTIVPVEISANTLTVNNQELILGIFKDISERKKAEEKVKHLASFPENNPYPVLETNFTGKITFLNPAAIKTLRSLGLTEKDASVFLPKDTNVTLNEAKHHGKSVVYREVGIKNKIFGESLQILRKFQVIRIYAYDITERKIAEELQKKSQEQLSQFFGSSPVGLAIYDSNLRFVKVNEQLADISGLSPSQHLGKTIIEILPNLAPLIVPILQKVILTEKPVLNVEISAKTPNIKNCTSRWTASYFPISFDNNKSKGAGIILAQTSKATKIEKNHRNNLPQDYSLIEENNINKNPFLESIGEGIIATTLDGKVAALNRQSEQILGLKSENSIGKEISCLWQLEDMKGNILPVEKQPITIALKTGKIVKGNYQLIRSNKSKIPLEITASPVISGKKTIGTITIYNNISDKVEIDNVKSEFISMASHQLRTPLSTIGWYVERLLYDEIGQLNNNQKKYLEGIYKANQEMVRLANSLLDASRIDLETYEIKSEQVNMKIIANQVIGDLKQHIKAQNITITKKYCKHIKVLSDPDILTLILRNILTNAVNYTQKKGVVNLEISRKMPGKQEKFKSNGKINDLFIKVSDTGYGIPEEDQSKIFQKMFRARNVKNKEGTGLGLYIAKSMINRLGGKITFESQLNKGTSFYISIPVRNMKGGDK